MATLPVYTLARPVYSFDPAVKVQHCHPACSDVDVLPETKAQLYQGAKDDSSEIAKRGETTVDLEPQDSAPAPDPSGRPPVHT